MLVASRIAPRPAQAHVFGDHLVAPQVSDVALQVSVAPDTDQPIHAVLVHDFGVGLEVGAGASVTLLSTA